MKLVGSIYHVPLPVLHAVFQQVIDVVASLIEELQSQHLLVCVELLVRCHIRQFPDLWVQS